MNPPTEPAPVHNPERPTSLATRRNQSPGRLGGPPVAGQSSDARPPPAAIDHAEQLDTLASDSEVESEPGAPFHITDNIEELFRNLPSAVVLEEPDVLDLTSHRKVNAELSTEQFEEQLKAKAPELLEQWKRDRQTLYEVQDLLQKQLENSRQLREAHYLPLPDSKKLGESVKMRKAAEKTGLMSPVPSRSTTSSQRFVQQEVDRIDRGIGSPTSPGPSPLRTSSSIADGGTRSPAFSSKRQSRLAIPRTPRSSKELKHEGELQALEVQVKLLLTPAIVLLSKSDPDAKDLDCAYDAARRAWKQARTRGMYREGAALAGMCEYYIGICLLAQPKLSAGRGDCGRGAERFFAKASVDAAGYYAEAEMAEKALADVRRTKRQGSVISAASSGRPGTVLSDLFAPRAAEIEAPSTEIEESEGRPKTAESDRPGTSGTIASLNDDEARQSTWWNWRSMIKSRPQQNLRAAMDGIHELQEGEEGGASPPFGTLGANSNNALETERSPVGSPGDYKTPSERIEVDNDGIRHYERRTQRIPSFTTDAGSEVAERMVQKRAETPDSGFDRGGLGGLRMANAGSVSGSSRSAARPPPPGPGTVAPATPATDSFGNQTSPGLIRLPSSPAQSPGGTPKDLPTEIPSPVTSPTSSHSKQKSVAFSLSALGALNLAPDSLTGGAGAGSSTGEDFSHETSPTSISSASIMARRMMRKSISSIATVSVHNRDRYRDAEEGRSPYRATFADVAEEGFGSRERGRKKSAEEMV